MTPELKLVIPIHNCCGNCKFLKLTIEAGKGICRDTYRESFECKNNVGYANYFDGDYDNDDTSLERWLHVCELWEKNEEQIDMKNK